MKIINRVLAALALSMLSLTSLASSLTVKMYRVASKGHGSLIGTIEFADTENGLVIRPALHGLQSGRHGFHVHVKPSCDAFAKAAGGHFDPDGTGKHLGPYNGHGHLGDLPFLVVNQKGEANQPDVAPRLTVADIRGHAIMVHADGDNYADKPKPLGGGGARVACGVAG